MQPSRPRPELVAVTRKRASSSCPVVKPAGAATSNTPAPIGSSGARRGCENGGFLVGIVVDDSLHSPFFISFYPFLYLFAWSLSFKLQWNGVCLTVFKVTVREMSSSVT